MQTVLWTTIESNDSQRCATFLKRFRRQWKCSVGREPFYRRKKYIKKERKVQRRRTMMMMGLGRMKVRRVICYEIGARMGEMLAVNCCHSLMRSYHSRSSYLLACQLLLLFLPGAAFQIDPGLCFGTVNLRVLCFLEIRGLVLPGQRRQFP